MLADAWNDVKTNTLNKAVGKSFQKLNEDVWEEINELAAVWDSRFLWLWTPNGSTAMLSTQAFSSWLMTKLSKETTEDGDNDEEVEEESESTPWHHEAFNCLDTAMKWYERTGV
jgi:hypothetical protein